MKDLMLQYQQTADNLYRHLKQLKPEDIRYRIVVAEYQHTRKIFRQLKSYCKVRGLL